MRVPTNIQRFGGVKDQLYIAGFGVVGHRVVGIVGSKQRVYDALWTARNLIGAFIDEFGIRHRNIFTGQNACECARDTHLQVLRVLGVIVHLHGFGQRPQANQRRAGFSGLSYRRQCRDRAIASRLSSMVIMLLCVHHSIVVRLGSPQSPTVTAQQQLRTGHARASIARLSARLRLQTVHWTVCFTAQPQRGEPMTH